MRPVRTPMAPWKPYPIGAEGTGLGGGGRGADRWKGVVDGEDLGNGNGYRFGECANRKWDEPRMPRHSGPPPTVCMQTPGGGGLARLGDPPPMAHDVHWMFHAAQLGAGPVSQGSGRQGGGIERGKECRWTFD